MNPNGQVNASEPPIGLAGVAALVALLATHFLVNSSVWWADCIFISGSSILAAFSILYRSSWHHELPKAARILSLLLSASIIFLVVLAGSFVAIIAASAFFSGSMVST